MAKFNKITTLALAASVAVGAAGSASAATFIDNTPGGPKGTGFATFTQGTNSGSGSFGWSNDGVGNVNPFQHSFTFTTTRDGRLSSDVFSTSIDFPRDNVNFVLNGVRLNPTSPTVGGVPFQVISVGLSELRRLTNVTIAAGTHTISVRGTAGQNGFYNGTLAFVVPEPSTWALMILGFGLTGFAMRRRRSTGLAAA